MGWFDGFAPAGMGFLAAGWPGLREHLEAILVRQAKERAAKEQQEEEEAEDSD